MGETTNAPKDSARPDARVGQDSSASAACLTAFRISRGFCFDVLSEVEGQISEAVSRQDWYTPRPRLRAETLSSRSWGAHYLRSLSRAHFAQVCNNFKVQGALFVIYLRVLQDPGVQFYGGELFREVRDMADEIFLRLPAPNPAQRSQVGRCRGCV